MPRDSTLGPMSTIQTADPVIAVILVKQEEHGKLLMDHEARLRPLERLASRITLLAFVGAAVGAALINFIFQRLGAL